MMGGAVFLVMFLIGYLLYSRPRAGETAATDRAKPGAGSVKEPSEEVWMHKLLLMTRGNRGAIERGVLARRRRFPRASRAELLELLYQDYLRDRS